MVAQGYQPVSRMCPACGREMKLCEVIPVPADGMVKEVMSCDHDDCKVQIVYAYVLED